MRFWNWRPWPVRGRKKTLLLGGRFGNDGIGQVPSKSQRVTVFGVVFVNTAEKYHPQEKFWGERCQEVRGVSLHFFGSSPLIWQKSHAASPILSGEVNALRHDLVMFLQFAKIPATENSEIGTDSSWNNPLKNLGWIGSAYPPQPHPPFTPGSFRDLPGKNEIPTSPRFSASTQHLVGGWSSIGVWGFGV